MGTSKPLSKRVCSSSLGNMARAKQTVARVGGAGTGRTSAKVRRTALLPRQLAGEWREWVGWPGQLRLCCAGAEGPADRADRQDFPGQPIPCWLLESVRGRYVRVRGPEAGERECVGKVLSRVAAAVEEGAMGRGKVPPTLPTLLHVINEPTDLM